MAKKNGKKRKPATQLVTLGRDIAAQHGFVNPPVYRGSTVLSARVADMNKDFDDRFQKTVYGRFGTPTHFALQQAVAALEGGHKTIAVGSGKAAVLCALLAFLKHGDHLLMVDSAYGPTRGLCQGLLARMGVETGFYDPMIGEGIARLIRPNTRAVFLESPGSLTFEVQDAPAIARIARRHGAVSIIDNTWATPLYFKPFEHGIDVSIQAGTKYIVGHSDALMGFVTATEAVYPRLVEAADALGSAVGPDDCYLALRGLRTLEVRLERHQKTALALADWLKGRGEVLRVLHPALPDSPGHAFWKRDFSGASGLFAVVLKPVSDTALAACLDGLELFGKGYSWGGYESLVIPARPEALRTATRWAPGGSALRLHAGLEDADDLIADLAGGLQRLARSG